MPSLNQADKREAITSLIVPAISYGVLAYLIFLSMWPHFYLVKHETIIILGAFAAWRYGWLLINYLRSGWYAIVHFPRLLRRVEALQESRKYPEHVFFIIMAYNEEPWITIESLQSIMSNLASIPSQATLIVSTGSERDDAAIYAAYMAHPARKQITLVIQHQNQGKRIAMGHALRAVSRRYHKNLDEFSNCVTLFMDGDSFLPPNTLKRTLPFFLAYRSLGALTTDETAFINTESRLYQDWFNLKFGQRHVLFQSHSLSHKVLTLTGRFSMARTSICVDEEFIRQIENDILTHWLHGKFRFLMGDDKSTWFYFLKKGWKMLYIPNVRVVSLESRDEDFFLLSRTLPYRWYGNTLRNNARALALGPRKTGWFIWLAILDQRLTVWTALVGIVGAIILSFTVSYVYLPFYIAWVISVRIIQMSVIACTGHTVSMLTIPLMLYNQWFGALIKIHAMHHLSDQKWAKGGQAQASGKPITVDSRMARWLPDYIMILSVAIFIFVMLLYEGALQLPQLAVFYTPDATPAAAAEPELIPANRMFMAAMYGVIPDDGKDDAYALGKLMNRVPPGSVIRLPAGQLDFFEPLVIKRSNIRLEGTVGSDIVSHISLPGAAVIELHGQVSRRKFRLAADVEANAGQLTLASGDSLALQPDNLIQLRAPNDKAFLERIHSRIWHKAEPWVRQAIVRVKKQSGSTIELSGTTGVTFPANISQIRTIEPVKDVTLSGFSLRQQVPGHHISEVRLKFKNAFPEYAVDGIRLSYADNCVLKNLVIRNAGRHPVHLENSYGCKLIKLDISGAWNKGKKGNGYVRISRSYHNEFTDSTIRNIRHITLQWSSAFNQLTHLKTAVDINFHGGYAHDNLVDGIRFTHQKGYKWKAITRISDDARWAPPDGPDNIVLNVKTIDVVRKYSR